MEMSETKEGNVMKHDCQDIQISNIQPDTYACRHNSFRQSDIVHIYDQS